MQSTVQNYESRATRFESWSYEPNNAQGALKARALFLTHLLAAYKDSPEDLCILDAGCGPGRDMLEFKKEGLQVVGFDPSDTFVKIARERTESKIYCADFNTFTSEGEK